MKHARRQNLAARAGMRTDPSPTCRRFDVDPTALVSLLGAAKKQMVEIARAVQQVSQHKIPVTCGSGALPMDIMQQMYDEGLVDSVCFNLEIWWHVQAWDMLPTLK